MKDVHTHVLPFVDDGSQDLSQSLIVLREMAKKGITDAFCTPHFNRKYNLQKERIKEVFLELNKAVKEEKLPINLFLGQEIFITDKIILNGLENCLTLNGSKYVLVEFPFDGENEIVESVYSLTFKGYVPVIAHYERYARSTIYEAYEIKSVGGLIQINADSLGRFNKRRRLTLKLLKERLVDYVASDMHFSRKNQMDKAYKLIKRKFVEEYANEIFEKNIDKIIKG